MKLSLLVLVQDMLAAIEAEEVTDVGETTEAGMCVQIANRCFEQVITSFRWRHTRRYAQLTATAAFNELAPPDGCIALDPYHVYYGSQRILYYRPEDFMQITILRTGSNIISSNNINIYNDRAPIYFTSDDDQTLVFDALDSPTSGLDATKSLALGYFHPTARLGANADVFALPAQIFPAFEQLCIANAIGELKGDVEGAKQEVKDSMALISRQARLSRLIDLEDDIRQYIVPRQSASKMYSSLINTGDGFI